ncbi:DUF1311 domain-containing protein [Brenneria sp. 4F2]|nr:DUF1311 domain-containing protein [Brenneria bubanii]
MRKLLVVLITIALQTSAAAATYARSPSASDNAAGNGSNLMKTSAESALNTAYRDAKKRIETAYSADADLGRRYLQTLLDSQRGWLKYRDGQCDLEAFLAEEGTKANDQLTDGCVSKMDRERIVQLNAMPYQ